MAKRVRTSPISGRGAALSREQPQDLTDYATFTAAMNEAISENLCGFAPLSSRAG
jgi:hypothetical protein